MPMRLRRAVGRAGNLLVLAGLLALTAPSNVSAATAFFEPDIYDGGYVRDMRVIDFDDDRHDDIVTARGGDLSLWFGDGTGGFDIVDHPIAATVPSAIEVADMDRDGALDVLVVDAMESDIRLLRGDGDRGLEASVTVSDDADPVFAVGDFGGSGALDIAMSRSLGQISLLIQQPDGSFDQESQLSVLSSPSGLITSDLDEDGDDDLVVSAGGQVFTFLRGAGGAFDPYTLHTVTGTSDVDIADVNSDGNLDIATVSYGGSGVLSVLTATSPGVWGPAIDHPVGVSAAALEVQDLDGDSDADVVVVPAAEERARLMLQREDGGFDSVEVDTFYTAGAAGQSGLADFDEDGEVDLALSVWGRHVQVAFGDALSVTPSWIDFGWLQASSAATRPFTVRNTGSSALAPGSIDLVGDMGPFSIVDNGCLGRTLDRRETCAVSVRFVAPGSTDQFSAGVEIQGSAASGPRFVALDAASWLPAVLLVDPGTVDFGYTAVGAASLPRSVRIVNGGGDLVYIESAVASPGFAVTGDACSDAVLGPGEACTVSVSFRPMSSASLVGSLTVAAAGAPPVSATLSGHGTRSPFTRSPRSRLPQRLPLRLPVRPAVDVQGIEAGLADLTDAIPRLIRGGPVRPRLLPVFKAPIGGRLSLALLAWNRGQRVRIGGGVLRFNRPSSGRLSFRLNRALVKILRRPKATHVKAVVQFVPPGGSVIKQAPEFVVKPPLKKPKRR